MNENNYIVVCDPVPPTPNDPPPPFREGDVLDEARARQWEPAGVLLLPVHAPHLPQRGASGSLASTAYQRHVYGADAVLFDNLRFTKGCAIPVCMPSNTARIEWMARVRFAGEEGVGQLKLTGEETAHGFLRMTESETGSRGGRGPIPDPYLLRGSANVAGTERCFGAVCLAGACVGVRVLWFALTVLPR